MVVNVGVGGWLCTRGVDIGDAVVVVLVLDCWCWAV